MKKRDWLFGTILIGLLLAMTGNLLAQPGPPERREEIRERLQTIKKWRLVETLDLSEDQTTKLFPRMNAIDDEVAAFNRERVELLKDLEAMLRLEANEDELQAKMDALEELEKAHHEKMRELREAVMDVLTVKQQAQYLIFEQRFEEHLRQMLQEYRDNRRPERN